MSALRRLRETDAEITFKPWIFEIARNAAIDQYRRNTRTEEVSIDIEGGFAPSDVLARGAPARARLVGARQGAPRPPAGRPRRAVGHPPPDHRDAGARGTLLPRDRREDGAQPAAVESTLFRARRKLEHEYAELDTGRRCRLMGAVIGRLAEGIESGRDRRRLDRHARRCSTCRRRARELGVEPMLPRDVHRAPAPRPCSRCPRSARRRIGGETAGGAAQQAAAPMAPSGAHARGRRRNGGQGRGRGRRRGARRRRRGHARRRGPARASAERAHRRSSSSSPKPAGPSRRAAPRGPARRRSASDGDRGAGRRREGSRARRRASRQAQARRRRRRTSRSPGAGIPASRARRCSPVPSAGVARRRAAGGRARPRSRPAPSSPSVEPGASAAAVTAPSEADVPGERHCRVLGARVAPTPAGAPAGSLPRRWRKAATRRLVPRVAHGHQPLLDGGLLLR